MKKNNLGSTLGSTTKDDKIDDILNKAGLSDKQIPASLDSLKNDTEERLVKINAELTVSQHLLFKTHTALQKVDMKVKLRELVNEWLSNQPKIGI